MKIETLASLIQDAGIPLPEPPRRDIRNEGPDSFYGHRGEYISWNGFEWYTGIGQIVTPEIAMSVGAVYACVRLIAGATSGLPRPVYRYVDGSQESVEHPYWYLLNRQPNPISTAKTFWKYLWTSLLLTGDAFAYLDWKRGTLAGMYQVNPRSVEKVYLSQGELWYRMKLPGEKETVNVSQWDMLHIPNIGLGDDYRGMSPLAYAAREAVGIARAADQYSSAFFRNGARPDYFLTTAAALPPDQVTQIRNQLQERYSGVGNSHLPGILTGGMDIKTLSIKPEDSQLLATRAFSVEDIARIFGVPPFMIGHTEKTTSWGSGVEQMGIGFVKYSLQDDITSVDQEVNRKLFGIERYFVETKTEGLERGDIKTRYEAYARSLGGSTGPGWKTPNEIRKLDNEPPIDGGDQLTTWSKNNAAVA